MNKNKLLEIIQDAGFTVGVKGGQYYIVVEDMQPTEVACRTGGLAAIRGENEAIFVDMVDVFSKTSIANTLRKERGGSGAYWLLINLYEDSPKAKMPVVTRGVR